MIETKKLSVGYGSHCVLKDITVGFLEGRVTVLIGPNGCGKSTLLKTVLGLQPSLGGEVLYDGSELGTLGPRQVAKRAAYLTQTRNTPNISVNRLVLHGRFPYLDFPRQYREEDYEEVRHALKEVDAEELYGKRVKELSGGQRQRVYLAMALAQNTKTVFLDEPTTYLDIGHQLDMLWLVRKMADSGKAVVMVLHDLCLAMKAADWLLVFNDGGIQFKGTPEQALETEIFKQIFHVELSRIKTVKGWQYFYNTT